MSKNVPSKVIYLIRHGETDYNLKGIVQGSGVNSSLNSTGRDQAKAFFNAYKDVPFQKIYTSQLKRTRESVQNFIDRGIPYEELAELNEISWGINEGKPPSIIGTGYYRNLVNEWKNGNSYLAAEGGESPDQVLERQKRGIKYILSKKNEENILIASHGRAIRILLAHLMKFPTSMMDLFRHENLCLYKLHYFENKDSFEIIDSCNTKHLRKLKSTL